jgi:protein phosphatase
MGDAVLSNRIWIEGLSDVGKTRANNEDAWWAGRLAGGSAGASPAQFPLLCDVDPALILVSDGVGGANAGETASRMAVTLVADGLAGAKEVLRPGGDCAAILAAMKAANRAIFTKAAEPGFEGMAATLSALCIAGNSAFWAQAGDSRIYVFRDGKLRQISHDHSPVGRMRQAGKITEAEARKHSLRNQIDMSLGDPPDIFQPDSGEEEARPGDLFLLCSDGLSDGLWDHEIAGTLAGLRGSGDLRQTVKRLVMNAKRSSGRDNITAVVALIEPAPGPGKEGRGMRLMDLLRRWRNAARVEPLPPPAASAPPENPAPRPAGPAPLA